MFVGASLGAYVAASVALLAGQASLARAAEEQCQLGPYIRPIIMMSGFGGSPLFNSSNDFKLEWVDLEDFAPDADPNAADDFFLPITWNEANLTQDKSPVGPEAFPGDEMPGFLSETGAVVPFLTPVRFRMLHA